MPRGTRKRRRMKRQEEATLRTKREDLERMVDQIDAEVQSGDVILSVGERGLIARVRKLLYMGTPVTLAEDAKVTNIWKRAMGYEWEEYEA